MSEEFVRLPEEETEHILTLLRCIDARLTRLEECLDRWLMEEHSMWLQILFRLDGIDAKPLGEQNGVA